MPTNNFKIFDENKQNMYTDQEYNSATQRVNGVQTGVASSKLQNKSMYQTSLIAYALAQIMNQNGLDANDSDLLSTFISNLRSGIAKSALDECYSKQQNISDTTKASYGINQSAIPDDVFNIILNTLGSIQSNANSRARIELGEYTGSVDQYAQYSEKVITFNNIEPQILFVIPSQGDFRLYAIVVKGISKYSVVNTDNYIPLGDVEFGPNYVKLSASDTTVNYTAPIVSMNRDSVKYSYFAIGTHVDTSASMPMVLTPVVGKGINLFDNGYFIGGGTAGQFPINQRGNTTGTVNAEVFIDRWILNGSYNLYANSLWLSQGSFFSQKIDPALGAFLNGKTVTVSLLHADGTLDTGSAVYVASPSENVYIFRGTRCYACLVGTLPNQLFFVPDMDNIGVVAVKLELGSQQTLARQVNGAWVLNDPPPNYQQELAKCQRYLQVFEGWEYAPIGHVYPASATQLSIAIPLTVPMKGALASIDAGTTVYVSTNGGWNQTVTIPASSQNVRLSPNFAQVDVTLTSALLGTFPSMALLSCTPTTKLIISAE